MVAGMVNVLMVVAEVVVAGLLPKLLVATTSISYVTPGVNPKMVHVRAVSGAGRQVWTAIASVGLVAVAAKAVSGEPTSSIGAIQVRTTLLLAVVEVTSVTGAGTESSVADAVAGWARPVKTYTPFTSAAAPAKKVSRLRWGMLTRSISVHKPRMRRNGK